MEVAISVAGQIIESYQALLPNEQAQGKNKGIAWKEIKQLISGDRTSVNLTTHSKNNSEDLAIMNDEVLTQDGAVK